LNFSCGYFNTSFTHRVPYFRLKRITKSFQILLICLGGSNLSLFAQNSPPEDYREAFEQLLALGFPDAGGATYIKLKAANREDRYYYNRSSITRLGDAWLLPAKGNDGVRQIIKNQIEITSVKAKPKKGFFSKVFKGDKSKDQKGGPKIAEWTEVDPKKEVAALLKALGSSSSSQSPLSPDRWSYSDDGAKTCATLLATACHFHQAGHQELGNQLAEKILKNAPNPTQVIDLLVSKLADAEYQKIYSRFTESQNWVAYLADLRAIKKKFPRGWSTGLGVELLIPKVEKRVKNEEPKLRQFTGAIHHPTVIKHLDALLTESKPINISLPSSWLINPQGDYRHEYENKATPSPWLQEILNLGMEALPALIAASADDTLVPAQMKRVDTDRYYGGSSFYMGNSSLEHPEENIFNNMSRPVTRGQIVRTILNRTLPDPDSSLAEATPADYQAIAHEWWKAHRSSPLDKIAQQFLEDNDSLKIHVSVEFLIGTGKESNFKVVENNILQSGSFSNSTELVKLYLKKRKGKAKEFFKKYSVEVKAEMAERYANSTSNGEPVDTDERANRILKPLEVFVQEHKPEDIFAAIKSGKTKLGDGIKQLQAITEPEKSPDHLPALLEIIDELDEASERMNGLTSLTQWVSRDFREKLRESPDSNPLPDFIPQSKEIWEKLLSRTESFPDDFDGSSFGNPPSEAHHVGWAMDAIYFPNHRSTVQQLNRLIPVPEVWKLMLKRGRDLLESGRDSYFPSAENVTGERKEAIKSALTQKTAPEIISYYETLSIDEKLNWDGIIYTFEEKIPQGMANLSLYLGKISWAQASSIPDEDRKKFEGLLVNQKLTKELIKQVLKEVSDYSKNSKNILVSFYSRNQPGEKIFLRIGETDQENFVSWKENFYAEANTLATEKKINHFSGLIAWGLVSESNDEKKAVFFDPPIDKDAETKAFDDLVSEIEPLIKPHDPKAEQESSRILNFILFGETLNREKSSTDK